MVDLSVCLCFLLSKHRQCILMTGSPIHCAVCLVLQTHSEVPSAAVPTILGGTNGSGQHPKQQHQQQQHQQWRQQQCAGHQPS